MKNTRMILLLSHTWGIIMTLIGYGARLVFRSMGKKGEKIGFTRVYTIGKGWGGLNLGTTIIISQDCYPNNTVAHEMGHGIQNAIFGIFYPFIVFIPSTIRYHYRNYLYRKGITPKTKYDDIWFEGQATKLGLNYFCGGLKKW